MERFHQAGGGVDFSNANGNTTTTTSTTRATTGTTLATISSGGGGGGGSGAPLQVSLVAGPLARTGHIERQQHQNQSLHMRESAAAVPGPGPELLSSRAGSSSTILETIVELATNRRLELFGSASRNLTLQQAPIVVGQHDAFVGDSIVANQSGAATLTTNMMLINAHQQHHQQHHQYQHQHQVLEHNQQDHNYHHELLAGPDTDTTSLASIISKLSPWELALVALLIILILISIVGNCLVCIAIFTDRRLRKLGNAFIVSLAIADLFVSCLVMTFALCNDLMDYWVFGEWFCDIWISFDIMCCTASILNLCAISLDRFIHIKDCLLYNQLMTRRVAISSVIIIWIISALVSFVPINLGWHKPNHFKSPAVPATTAPASLLLSPIDNNNNSSSDGNFGQYLTSSGGGNNEPPINIFTSAHSLGDTVSRTRRSVPWGSHQRQLASHSPFGYINISSSSSVDTIKTAGRNGQIDLRDSRLVAVEPSLVVVQRGVRDNQVGGLDGRQRRPEFAQESARNYRHEHRQWTPSSGPPEDKDGAGPEQQQQQQLQQQQRGRQLLLSHRDGSGGQGESLVAEEAPLGAKTDHYQQKRRRRRRRHLFQSNGDGSQHNGGGQTRPQPLTRTNNAHHESEDSISSPLSPSSSGGQFNRATAGFDSGGPVAEARSSGGGPMMMMGRRIPSAVTQPGTSLHNSRAPLQAQVDFHFHSHELEQTSKAGGDDHGNDDYDDDDDDDGDDGGGGENHYYYYKLAGGKESADQVESNPQDGSQRRQQIGRDQSGAKGGGGALAELRQQRRGREKRQALQGTVTKSSLRLVGGGGGGRASLQADAADTRTNERQASSISSGSGGDGPVLLDHHRSQTAPAQLSAGSGGSGAAQGAAALHLQSSWSSAPVDPQRHEPHNGQLPDSTKTTTTTTTTTKTTTTKGTTADGRPGSSAAQLPQCMLTLTPTYAIISSTISFYIPCLIMLGLYIKLFACARRHMKNIRAITRAPEPIGVAAAAASTRPAAAATRPIDMARAGSYQRQQEQQSISRLALEQSNCLTTGTNPTTMGATKTSTNCSYSGTQAADAVAANGAGKCAGLKLHHWTRTWIKFGRLGGANCPTQGPRPQEAELKSGSATVASLDQDQGRASARSGSSSASASSLTPSSSSPSPPRIDGCTIGSTIASCSPGDGDGDGGGAQTAESGKPRMNNRKNKKNNRLSCGDASDLASGDTAQESNDKIVDRRHDQRHHHNEPGSYAANSSPREDEPFLAKTSESIMNETSPCCDRGHDSSQSQLSGSICNHRQHQQQLVPGAQVMNSRAIAAPATKQQQTRKQNFSATTIKLNLTPRASPLISGRNGGGAGGGGGERGGGRPPHAVSTMVNHNNNNQHQQQQHKQQTSQLATHKAAITLGIIMGTFLFCWVPFFCLNIIKAFFVDSIPSSMFRAFTWLGYANSALNPIIYGIHNTEFRNAFNRIFFKHLSLKNGRHYLNRRFSYDLRHHHHHQQGQQQQQQQQQQHLSNNHHRHYHHHHHHHQLQPAPLTQQQQQQQQDNLDQLKRAGREVDLNNNNFNSNSANNNNNNSGSSTIKSHVKCSQSNNESSNEQYLQTSSLLAAEVAADVGPNDDGLDAGRQLSTSAQKSCTTLRRSIEAGVGEQSAGGLAQT